MVIEIHSPRALIEHLCQLPSETEWVEFKENKFNEDSVGQYVSALANSAMLEGKEFAYLVYGIKDSTHEIVGTSVDLFNKSVGNDNFVFWLNKHLDPHINIKVETVYFDSKRVEILCIEPNYHRPVRFKGRAYIRVGASQQPLTNYPDREAALWQITNRHTFEDSFLSARYDIADLRNLFAFKLLLKKLGIQNDQDSALVDKMEQMKLIKHDMQGKFQASNLLAIACAKQFEEVDTLRSKGSRVVVYKGTSKLDASYDKTSRRGHLVTFMNMMEVVMSHIPVTEEMETGTRVSSHAIPEVSIREFLANALVHQDFSTNDSTPIVEIYKDRVRITNPGEPLVSVDRFIDTPSRSRNPRFTKLMHDAGYCEQRGSGVDRAIQAIEKASLPPPLIESIEGSVVVTLYMKRKFAKMTPEERVRACFQHACLMYENNDPMSNASLRKRLGLGEKQHPQVSGVIKDAITAGRIKPLSEDQGNRNARYIPYYATVS